MSISQQILFFISAIGAFNGILLSLYLFFSKKRRTIPSFFLGLLLLAISVRVMKSVFVSFNPSLPKVWLQIGLSACFLIGPALYYFNRSVLARVTKVPRSWKIILVFWIGLLLIVSIIIPYETHPAIWSNYFIKGIYFQWAAYVVATGILLRQLIGKLISRQQLDTPERFLLLTYFANLLIDFVYMMALTGRGFYLSGAISFSIFLYLTLFFYFYNRKVDSILLKDYNDAFVKTEKKKIAAL